MDRKASRIDGMMYRAADGVKVIDEDKRLIQVSFSSEREVKRVPFFGKPWIEVLGHNAGEVDLSRLNDGATVHYNHSRTRQDRIGVVESAKIEGGRGHAVLRLSQRDDVSADIWPDVRDNLLRNISVGYAIRKRELVKSTDDLDTYRVTEWEPMEISLVDIPADPSVGVGRDADELITRAMVPTDFKYRVISLGDQSMDGQQTQELETARQEAVKVERKRVTEIEDVFTNNPGHEVLRTECVRDPECTGMSAYRLVCKAAPNGGAPSGRIEAVAFGTRDQFNQSVVDGVLLRAGVLKRDEATGQVVRDLSNMSFVELARSCLSLSGKTIPDGPAAIVSRAFATTDDFPNLLANVAEKSVVNGFNNPDQSGHTLWMKQTFARDFKTSSRVALSEFEDLLLINEAAEYTYGDFKDAGINVQVGSYGRIFTITRQAIINDDLNALVEVPSLMGESARRTEADAAWTILTTNPVVADGVTLFNATHNNIGTGGALSVTTLGELRKLMRVQTGLQGLKTLNIQPSYLIVPAELETLAEQLLNSVFDPGAGTSVETSNPFYRALQMIVEPRLDVDSTTQYYVSCNPNRFGWAELIYLEGMTGPLVEQKEGWTVAGTEFRVTHDFGVQALFHHGATRNAGV